MSPAVTERTSDLPPGDGRPTEAPAGDVAARELDPPEDLQDPARASANPAPIGARATWRIWTFSVTALAVIGATALVSLRPDSTVPVAPAQSLASLPRALGDWVVGPAPPADAMPLDPNVVQHLYRTYQRGADTAWISVGYYPMLAPGRHPQAQKLILPARGYAEMSTRTVDVAVAPDGLAANLVVMRGADREVATLYWYHVGGRSVASDHGYRARLLFNRVWRRRSDVALIRVVSPIPRGNAEPVIAAQVDFVRALYPELRRTLPE